MSAVISGHVCLDFGMLDAGRIYFSSYVLKSAEADRKRDLFLVDGQCLRKCFEESLAKSGQMRRQACSNCNFPQAAFCCASPNAFLLFRYLGKLGDICRTHPLLDRLRLPLGNSNYFVDARLAVANSVHPCSFLLWTPARSQWHCFRRPSSFLLLLNQNKVYAWASPSSGARCTHFFNSSLDIHQFHPSNGIWCNTFFNSSLDIH